MTREFIMGLRDNSPLGARDLREEISRLLIGREIRHFKGGFTLYIDGATLSEDERLYLDDVTNYVVKRTYPHISSLKRRVIKAYKDVDTYHPRESRVTTFRLIFDDQGVPVALAYCYGGGIARKKEADINYKPDAVPRSFYTGEGRYVAEDIRINAKEAFEKGLKFPFVVDVAKFEDHNIDSIFHRQSKSKIWDTPVYLHKPSFSFNPFVDEIRMSITRIAYKIPQLTQLPSRVKIIRLNSDYFEITKEFLNKYHPLNSLAKESLDEGIFYAAVEDTNGSFKILATAGLSYPTILPDGSRLFIASDLVRARDIDKSKGLIDYTRAATFYDLFLGGINGHEWFREDKKWRDALVVTDIPSTNIAARAFNVRLGYKQLEIFGTPFKRRWFTAGLKLKRGDLILSE